MRDFLDDFQWHSSIGIDQGVSDNRKFVSKLRNCKEARSYFIAAGSNLLVHKATNALWRVSDDKKSIVPVFDTDILSEDDLSNIDETK